MEFSINLDAQDWKAYTDHLSRWVRKQKRFTWRESLRNVLLWMVLGFIFAALFRGEFTFHWQTAVLVAAFFLAIMVVWVMESARNLVALSPEAGGSFIGQHRFRLDDEGIHSEGENYRATHRWAAIKRVSRDAGLIMLFIDRSFAFCLPEAKLADPEAVFRFVTAMVSNPQRI